MLRSLWTAATGMQAQALNIDVISNNLANVNTTGFKRSRADFQDLLYETIRKAGSASSESTEVPTGIQLGHGTRPAAVQKIFIQGDYQHTGNELDIAIEGDGFFQILQPSGEVAYTRAGSFKMDSEGRIVTSDGFLMEPEIAVPSDTRAISIGTDGTVSVLQGGSGDSVEIGTIELARFINPAGLNSIGRNLYLTTDASGDVVTGTAGENGFGTISQGYLEMSNVSVVDEMVNMITAQRAYEINSKSIQTADDMLQMANSLKR
ncbi:flagellar basal-body rod protein FlgG [Desulfosarcina sp. BuS5]|uniref:flagellar basal-body rod protein FlgG n=1 Tax=Desulfosarcina sp. BuS5 TaxID=933262 RepID=UPI000480C63A|nr:flagellar basal-body rod protein FlgG [Desulfosarcina sp. BuS5]WDN90020.1 flagellar basal-body rod protein FlgG [Desulfosarcina sp. BuS5]